MKKYILSFLLLSAALFAVEEKEEPHSFKYISIGNYLPIPITTFSVGIRSQITDNFAIDRRVSFATIFSSSDLEIHGKLLSYFNDNFYCGIGGCTGFSYLVFDHKFYSELYTSPIITLGHESDRSFQEINCRFPTFSTGGILTIPIVSLSFGWRL